MQRDSGRTSSTAVAGTNGQRWANWLLHGATAVLVACAVPLAILRLREALGSSNVSVALPATADAPQLSPRSIADWQKYAAAGDRMGPLTAPVTIVEFADFQCPFCRRAAPTLRALRQQYPTDLAVVYRHLPGHQFSFAAAVAAECAGRFASFERFHDALYAQFDSIGKKPWARFAREVGIRDTSRFTSCLEDATVAERVARDTLAASTLAVTGTPTFLINGIELAGYREVMLVGFVKAALDKARISH